MLFDYLTAIVMVAGPLFCGFMFGRIYESEARDGKA